MPNTTISVYLTDDEYIEYVEKKEEINKLVKELVKKEVKK